MNRKSETELIEKYLTDGLTPAEREGFDQRLAEDEDFNKEYQRHRTAHNALDYLIAKNLKNQLRELEDKQKVVSLTSRRRTRWTILSVAASVLLLVGFFALLFPSNQLSSPELAAEYYDTPNFSSRSANAAGPGKEALTKGTTAMQNGEYAQAISLFESVSEADPYYLTAQYFLGHALYLTGQYQLAEDKFATVSNSNDLRYTEAAQWYSLLCCLARNADCRTLLTKLTDDPGHPYHAQALEISNRLNK